MSMLQATKSIGSAYDNENKERKNDNKKSELKGVRTNKNRLDEISV